MKKGKFTSLMLAGMMAVTTLAGCGSGGKQAASKVDTSEAAQGKVLNIYCWNTEFQDRFEYFKKSGKLPSDVKVNFVVTPNENNAYQNALDAALLKQNDVPADEKIDIFLIEADYALKYVDSDYTLDVVNDIGLSKDALADQYQYTKDIVTDSKGVQKGTTWQATPGLFAYRRSIAKDVLGTDDPDAVQAAGKAVDEALGNDGRLLLRQSGTEPLIRVMVEAETPEICEKYVDQVIDVLKKKGHVTES